MKNGQKRSLSALFGAAGRRFLKIRKSAHSAFLQQSVSTAAPYVTPVPTPGRTRRRGHGPSGAAGGCRTGGMAYAGGAIVVQIPSGTQWKRKGKDGQGKLYA